MTRIPTAQSPRNTRASAPTSTPPATGPSSPQPAAPAGRQWYQRGEILAVIGLAAVLIELVLIFLLGWWALAINAVLALGGTAGYQAVKRKNPGWLRKLWPGRNGGPRLFSGGRKGPALFNSRPAGSPSRNPFKRMFNRTPGAKTPGVPGSKPTLGQRFGLRRRTPATSTTGKQTPGGGLFGRSPNRRSPSPSRANSSPASDSRSRSRRSAKTDSPTGGRQRRTLREWISDALVCPRCGHDRREEGCDCTALACRCRGGKSAGPKTGSEPAGATAPTAESTVKPAAKPAASAAPAAAKPDSRWTKCGQCGHGMVVVGCECTDPDCFCIYQDELPTAAEPKPKPPAVKHDPPPQPGKPPGAPPSEPQQEKHREPLPEPATISQPRHAAPAPEPGRTIRGGTGMQRKESLQGYVKGTKEWQTAAEEVAAAYAKAEAARDAFQALSGSLAQQGLTELPTSVRTKAELDDFVNRTKAAPDSSQGWKNVAAAAATLSTVAHQEHDADLRRADGDRAPAPVESKSDVRMAQQDM